MKNYYRDMGLNDNGLNKDGQAYTESELKKAYFLQSRLVHPDKNLKSSSDEAFKTLKFAYDLLIDKEKREDFDKERLNNPDLYDNNHLYLDLKDDVDAKDAILDGIQDETGAVVMYNENKGTDVTELIEDAACSGQWLLSMAMQNPTIAQAIASNSRAINMLSPHQRYVLLIQLHDQVQSKTEEDKWEKFDDSSLAKFLLSPRALSEHGHELANVTRKFPQPTLALLQRRKELIIHLPINAVLHLLSEQQALALLVIEEYAKDKRLATPKIINQILEHQPDQQKALLAVFNRHASAPARDKINSFFRLKNKVGNGLWISVVEDGDDLKNLGEDITLLLDYCHNVNKQKNLKLTLIEVLSAESIATLDQRYYTTELAYFGALAVNYLTTQVGDQRSIDQLTTEEKRLQKEVGKNNQDPQYLMTLAGLGIDAAKTLLDCRAQLQAKRQETPVTTEKLATLLFLVSHAGTQEICHWLEQMRLSTYPAQRHEQILHFLFTEWVDEAGTLFSRLMLDEQSKVWCLLKQNRSAVIALLSSDHYLAMLDQKSELTQPIINLYLQHDIQPEEIRFPSLPQLMRARIDSYTTFKAQSQGKDEPKPPVSWDEYQHLVETMGNISEFQTLPSNDPRVHAALLTHMFQQGLNFSELGYHESGQFIRRLFALAADGQQEALANLLMHTEERHAPLLLTYLVICEEDIRRRTKHCVNLGLASESWVRKYIGPTTIMPIFNEIQTLTANNQTLPPHLKKCVDQAPWLMEKGQAYINLEERVSQAKMTPNWDEGSIDSCIEHCWNNLKITGLDGDALKMLFDHFSVCEDLLIAFMMRLEADNSLYLPSEILDNAVRRFMLSRASQPPSKREASATLEATPPSTTTKEEPPTKLSLAILKIRHHSATLSGDEIVTLADQFGAEIMPTIVQYSLEEKLLAQRRLQDTLTRLSKSSATFSNHKATLQPTVVKDWRLFREYQKQLLGMDFIESHKVNATFAALQGYAKQYPHAVALDAFRLPAVNTLLDWLIARALNNDPQALAQCAAGINAIVVKQGLLTALTKQGITIDAVLEKLPGRAAGEFLAYLIPLDVSQPEEYVLACKTLTQHEGLADIESETRQQIFTHALSCLQSPAAIKSDPAWRVAMAPLMPLVLNGIVTLDFLTTVNAQHLPYVLYLALADNYPRLDTLTISARLTMIHHPYFATLNRPTDDFEKTFILQFMAMIDSVHDLSEANELRAQQIRLALLSEISKNGTREKCFSFIDDTFTWLLEDEKRLKQVFSPQDIPKIVHLYFDIYDCDIAVNMNIQGQYASTLVIAGVCSLPDLRVSFQSLEASSEANRQTLMQKLARLNNHHVRQFLMQKELTTHTEENLALIHSLPSEYLYCLPLIARGLISSDQLVPYLANPLRASLLNLLSATQESPITAEQLQSIAQESDLLHDRLLLPLAKIIDHQRKQRQTLFLHSPQKLHQLLQKLQENIQAMIIKNLTPNLESPPRLLDNILTEIQITIASIHRQTRGQTRLFTQNSHAAIQSLNAIFQNLNSSTINSAELSYS